MAFFLSPVLNEQQFDANGDPRAGALISTYLAGTITTVTTYKTSTGTAHTNPIQLDSSGNYPNGTQLWLLGGFSYKFVITDSDGSNSRTYDNITGVGDDLSGIDQWIVYAATPTYISATSFSVTGDQTNIFQANRRVRTINSGGTVYSTIASAVFGAGITTVTVVNDSGVLDAALSQVSYGLLSATNSSIPVASVATTGGVELATTAEIQAGTDTARVPSVDSMRNGLIVMGTPQLTTSGTSKDFTGVPPWAKQINIHFNGVSTTGTSPFLIQIGDAGGIENTLYRGCGFDGTGGGIANYTTGFGLGQASSAGAISNGTITLLLVDPAAFTWSAGGWVGRSDTAQSFSTAGVKALSAALDRVRLTTVGGVDTFDAGSINISWL